MAALFGSVAPWVGDDEELHALRGDTAGITSSVRAHREPELQDAGDDDVTQPYATCDTEPPPDDYSETAERR